MNSNINTLEIENKKIIEGFKLAYILSNFIGRLDHIHTEIQRQSVYNSTKIAISHNNKKVTYQELEETSNKLANYLIDQGITFQDTVGICLKESHLVPISILAVLKSGGTYVPLLNDYPQKRIDKIAKDASFKFIITDADDSDLTFENKEYKAIKLDKNLSILNKSSLEYTPVVIKNNDAAYIMFTSGSTGNPKGVIVEHRGLSSYLEWYLGDLQKTSGVNLPLTASICFAASITQLFTPLLLGETLHILDREIVKSPKKLLSFYQNKTGFGLYCVPTLWEEIINYAEEFSEIKIKSPECIYLSGEALSQKLVNRTFSLWPDIKIWNLYGPTEATANISYTEILKGDKIHLGKPIHGGNILVLDEDLNEVSKGEEGYIYITSRALARGYLNRPNLSATTFIENHNIETYKDFKLYNTGDRGRINANNELIFLGRNDQQVKVRGVRIELAEVEASLKEHPSIRQAACKITNDSKASIMAFLVTVNNTLHEDKIREFLKERLPDSMIPERFFNLEEMPKLANGKINKHELKATKNRPNVSYERIAPSNNIENTLISLWKDVIEIPEIGMNDDFFDLGGNSLKAIKLINAINKEFNTNLEINTIWNYTTPKQLLVLLDLKPFEKIATELPKKTPSKSTVFSLSFIQSSLWFLHQSKQEHAMYNLLFNIKFLEPIDLEKLKNAIAQIVNKHNILRSNFKVENKNPIRFINDKEISFDFINISSQEQQKNINDFERKAFEYRYNLETENLIKFTLFQISENEFSLYLEAHHIIFDGISINIFLKDLNEAYFNSKSFRKLSYDYSDFQKEWKSKYYSNTLNDSFSFWKKNLEESNYVFNLPLDYKRPKLQSHKGNTAVFYLNEEQKLKLEKFNKHNKVTNFMTLLAVYYVLLYKYSRENEILIGVPFANRTQNQHEDIIGAFVNTLVYKANLTDAKPFGELLQDIKNYTVNAISHQQYPFDKLVEKLNPERNAGINPIFQVLFAYHTSIEVSNKENTLKCTSKEIQNPNCKFDLDLEVHEEQNQLCFNFNYSTALFSSETMTLFKEHYFNILNQVIACKELETKDIKLHDLKENVANFVLNGAQVKVPNKCLHEYLEEQAIINPTKIAISTDKDSISFLALNKQANQLANCLFDKGVKNNDIVSVLMNRSLDMIISIYGILKAGAAYLPLDVNYPIERINTIINDSNSEILLTNKEINGIKNVSIINYSNLNIWKDSSEENPKIIVKPSDLAYVIYTSGTTDIPKGVMVQHEAICNRIDWMQKTYPINKDDVILQKTTYTFDVSVWELFWWTFTGSRLHLLKVDGEKNPEIICKAILDKKVSVMHFVPSMFSTFLEFISNKNDNILENLKYVFTSGEALEYSQVEKFKLINKKSTCKLINLYGPTEAAVDVTHYDTNNEAYKHFVPIGKPIQNTAICVLDSENNVLPFNVIGELALGGIGLAKGYLNRLKLTSEKFIYNNKIEKRLYKTGDLARILPDGNIEFKGRIDDQVKLRGYRIELGEIKNQLLNHPNVKDAVVILKSNSFEDKRLVAYYILKTNEEIDFNRFLKKSLPDYMVPSFFVSVDSIPIKSSGKLDIKKLPDPFVSAKRVIGEQVFNTEYEKKLAAIWTKVLKTDSFYAEDNFYDVGGHSLLLISMKSYIDKAFDIEISIVELFQYPTIKMLAEVIAANKKQNQKLKIASRAALQRRAMSNHIKNK